MWWWVSQRTANLCLLLYFLSIQNSYAIRHPPPHRPPENGTYSHWICSCIIILYLIPVEVWTAACPLWSLVMSCLQCLANLFALLIFSTFCHGKTTNPKGFVRILGGRPTQRTEELWRARQSTCGFAKILINICFLFGRLKRAVSVFLPLLNYGLLCLGLPQTSRTKYIDIC